MEVVYGVLDFAMILIVVAAIVVVLVNHINSCCSCYYQYCYFNNNNNKKKRFKHLLEAIMQRYILIDIYCCWFSLFHNTTLIRFTPHINYAKIIYNHKFVTSLLFIVHFTTTCLHYFICYYLILSPYTSHYHAST